MDNILTERETHFEKLVSFDNQSHGVLTEEDIRAKRDAVEDTEDLVASLNERLEAAMEKNTKLVCVYGVYVCVCLCVCANVHIGLMRVCMCL
ncbi:hypothetical protein EON63_14760 [archaeon]|nr:MAG: hypothetical protein EON63_14760 [archaeon]